MHTKVLRNRITITLTTLGLPFFLIWHDTNNMELAMSKWEHVCRSLQIYVALKCRQPWQEIRDGEKSQPFIIFPKSEEEMNMDALRREGKEIQGLMRSLKDASGQYRNFSAGSLPGCEGCHEACKKHMQTQL